MTNFVKKLHQLYFQKKRILENIKEKYAEHIRHIIKEPAYAYTDEERDSLEDHRLASLISRIFHHSNDLIFLLNELVTANAQLKHYADESDNQSLRDSEGIDVARNIEALQDAEITNLYIGLMQHVDKEQGYLIEIKMALAEIMQRRDWQEWIKHLMKFDDFMKEIEQGMVLFHKLLEKLIEKWHLERSAIEEAKHRFLVKGVSFNGKLIRGSHADFVYIHIDGEQADDYVTFLSSFASTFQVSLYRPKGKDYLYGFRSRRGVPDASGRVGSETSVVKSSIEMNPYEYLLTLHKTEKLGLFVQKIRSFELQPPLQHPPLKGYELGGRRGGDYDHFFESHPNANPLVIHFQPGSYVYSIPEVRQQVQEEISKNKNPNETIATLLYGENAFVAYEDLASISIMKEFLPHIRWMGLYKGLHFVSDIYRLNVGTTNVDSPGVFVLDQDFQYKRSIECHEFVRKFINRFGNSDTKIHILYESLQDLKMRKHFLQCLLDRTFQQLDSSYRTALEWLEAVGTTEEISEVRRYIERPKIEKTPPIVEARPIAPIPVPPIKPAESPVAPRAREPEPARPSPAQINFDILNQFIAKCSVPRTKFRDLAITEEELNQLELAAAQAEKIMNELISRAHQVDKPHLGDELLFARVIKTFADNYRRNIAFHPDENASGLVMYINSVIGTLQSFKLGEGGEIVEEPVNIELLQELIRRFSAPRAIIRNCIKSKREIRQIGVAASQAEAILTDLLSKAATQDERTKFNKMLQDVRAVKALPIIYLREPQRWVNQRADQWVKPLKDIIEVLKSSA